MKPKLLLLIVVLGLQTAWMLGTTLVQEQALAQGRVILLETRPVDPRDLLRGDYVRLNYKISDVPFASFSPALTNSVPPGQPVYVLLEPRGQFYEIVSTSLERLTPGPEQVLLKGRTEYSWNTATHQIAHVAYGLEQYFVREGTGNPQGKLTVQVAVPASGQGRIKEVFVDGKPYAAAMRGRGSRD